MVLKISHYWAVFSDSMPKIGDKEIMGGFPLWKIDWTEGIVRNQLEHRSLNMKTSIRHI